MKMRYPLLVLFFLLNGIYSYSQKVTITDFAGLEKELKVDSDTLIIVNFWATWCGPCVEEMPYFVQAQENFKESKIRFIYVSLDLSKQQERVAQFIKKKGMKGKFFILKDDPNSYINKIDKNWEGQIPFTLVVKKGQPYVTYNASFSSYKELDEFIRKQF